MYACCSIKLSHSDPRFRFSISKGNLQLSAVCQCRYCLLLCVTAQTSCQCCQGKRQWANSYSSAEAAARHGHCVAQASHSGGTVTGEEPEVLGTLCTLWRSTLSFLFVVNAFWKWGKRKTNFTQHLFIFLQAPVWCRRCTELSPCWLRSTWECIIYLLISIYSYYIFQSRSSSPRQEDSLSVAQKVLIKIVSKVYLIFIMQFYDHVVSKQLL